MTSLKPEEDYLDEDKPFRHQIKKQNYCILSMLTPKSFPEDKRDQYKDQKILGIKVRGVFENYEDAKKQADQLQKQDKYHNIFIGEVGKWLPFDVDIATMQTEEDPVYREQALNQYMKAYKDCLKEEEVTEKERKEQQLKGANVVTGKTDAPDYTGIGNPEIFPPGQNSKKAELDKQNNLTEKSDKLDEKNVEGLDELHEKNLLEKVKEYKTSNDEIQGEINKNIEEKNKIIKDLDDSKINLKELEVKLVQINQIYAELNK